jgi:hypothetical protein
MDKKEKAMAELRTLLEQQREYTEDKLRQFDEFFDSYISEDNFENAAEAKRMQDRLQHMLKTICDALNDMSEKNVEQYLKEANDFATYCENMS